MSQDLSQTPFRVEESPRSSFATLMNREVEGSHAARLTAIYSPQVTGRHYLSFSALGPSRLFINDTLIHHQTGDTKDAMAFLLGVQEEFKTQYDFEANKQYAIRIESYRQLEDTAELYLLDGQISAHLGFVLQSEMEADVIAEAVALAKDVDYAVVCVGNTDKWETEGQDMASMTLPADGSQDALILAVASVNPNTIVVNTTGVAVETPWIDEVAALVQAWYAGQETGNAILDVLLGEVNPSGKLPISWPVKYEHTACYGNFGLDSYESKEVEYVEGIFVGYRHFDRTYDTEKEVRFPFGYGLSYTQHTVSDVQVSGSITASSEVQVSFAVKNTGSRSGAETVQAYLAPPKSSTAERPPKALVGFKKVFSQPGESQTATVAFGKSDAAFWDESANNWQVESGEHSIIVSTSSSVRDIVATIPLRIDGFAFSP
jgi:beta-glucosidase